MSCGLQELDRIDFPRGPPSFGVVGRVSVAFPMPREHGGERQLASSASLFQRLGTEQHGHPALPP